MKLIRISIALNLLFIMLYGDPPDSVKLVMQNEMESERFLYRIKHFSKTPGAKVTDFTLGEPLKLFDILEQDLYNWNEFTSIKDMKPMWVFPVKEKGRTLFLIEIKHDNNEWIAAGGGYTGIAPELDNIFSSWPVADGYTPMLIMAYKCGTYFHIPQISNTNLTIIKPTIDENGKLINFEINKLKYSTLGELADFRKTYEKIYLRKTDNNDDK